MLSTQHVTASERGMAGMAWCSGPCSSPSVGAAADPADDGAAIVSMRGGSLICTDRLDVDAVRPTTECSLGSDRRVLAPPAAGTAAAADELDGDDVGCWT